MLLIFKLERLSLRDYIIRCVTAGASCMWFSYSFPIQSQSPFRPFMISGVVNSGNGFRTQSTKNSNTTWAKIGEPMLEEETLSARKHAGTEIIRWIQQTNGYIIAVAKTRKPLWEGKYLVRGSMQGPKSFKESNVVNLYMLKCIIGFSSLRFINLCSVSSWTHCSESKVVNLHVEVHRNVSEATRFILFVILL